MLEAYSWVEKYRPKNLDELVIPLHIKSAFKNGLTTNVILHGTTGTGKTSLAKLLVNKGENLEIDCSLDSSVQSARNRLIPYCTTTSLLSTHQFKFVTLTELELVSDEFFKMLCILMEKYDAYIKFVATTNNIHRIPPEILSRCTTIDFKFDDKSLKLDFAKRLQMIIKEEKVDITNNQILFLVNNYSPDYRSIVKNLQAYKEGSKKIDEFGKVTTGIFDVIFKENLNGHQIFSTVMTNYQASVDEVFSELSTELPNRLKSIEKSGLILKSSTLVHKYWLDSRTCNDRALALRVCVGQIYEMLHDDQ